ncbi:MAG: hypothetical protein QOD31_1811, partial [Pseudonocardiales bacterium]|nr:hypothetical protein [Pseudonocardiales bacterium]
NAEGEFQASAKLADAADVMSRNPTTLQLRYLQTLLEVGGNNNSTVIFPIPIDLIRPFLDVVKAAPASGAPQDAEAKAAEARIQADAIARDTPPDPASLSAH